MVDDKEDTSCKLIINIIIVIIKGRDLFTDILCKETLCLEDCRFYLFYTKRLRKKNSVFTILFEKIVSHTCIILMDRSVILYCSLSNLVGRLFDLKGKMNNIIKFVSNENSYSNINNNIIITAF